MLWLPPDLLRRIEKRGKIKKEGEIRVVTMLLFYIFSNGKHPFCDLKNPDFDFIQYCNDISSSKFFSTLNDSFLQKELETIFKNAQSFENISVITERLNKSHRLKDIIDKDCEIHERTSGKRYAILISCSNLKLAGLPELKASRADVTVLKTALEYCNFSVEARDGISKAKFLSSEIEDDSNRIEPIAATLRQINDEAINDNNIYIFLHVSTHGYYNKSIDDMCLYFEDGAATVKEIVNSVFSIVNKPNTHLIFTVEACRNFCFKADAIKLEFPRLPFAVFYSTRKGMPSADPEGVLGSFACAGPFSSALQENIKPAISLAKAFKAVKDTTEEKTGGLCSPEAEKANCASLCNFVF